VLSVSGTNAEPEQQLTLTAPNRRVRRLVDGIREEHEVVEGMERDVAGRNVAAAETLANEHPFLLTHDAVYETTFVY
jgi:hypothetical protein